MLRCDKILFTPRVQAKRRGGGYDRATHRPAPVSSSEDPAMLLLACLLLSFSGTPVGCTPAAPALSAPPAVATTSTPATTCRSAQVEDREHAASAVPASTTASATPPASAPVSAPPVAAPASPPRPASAPARVRAPGWQQRLPGMFR